LEREAQMNDQSDNEVRTTSGTHLRPKRKLDGDTSIAARIERARQKKLKELGVAGAPPIAAPSSRPARRANWTRTRTGSGRVGALPTASSKGPPTGSTSSRARPLGGASDAKDPHPTAEALPRPLAQVDSYPDSQKALALRDLDELQSRFAGRPAYEVRLNWFRYRCGLLRGEAAIKGIEEARGSYGPADPDGGHAQFLIGRILSDSGDHPAAIERFEQAIEIDPSHGHVRVELAKTQRIYESQRLSENSGTTTDPNASWFSQIFTRD
jgi:tetratricopeptide (TPR) repeat protein